VTWQLIFLPSLDELVEENNVVRTIEVMLIHLL